MGHNNVFKKINKGFNKTITQPSKQAFAPSNKSTSQPIQSKVIQPTQQVFTNDAVKNVINPPMSVVNDTLQQIKNPTTYIDMGGIDKLFGDKKTWTKVGDSIKSETNKTTRAIGDGVKGVYKDLDNLAEEAIGVFKNPYMIAVVGGVLIIGVIVVTSKK